jgi:parallel beta-helix repeat protein
MGRKLGCILGLILLVISGGFMVKVQRVEASDTIYIKADGVVEGTDKIVNVGNAIYTFMDNVNDSIWIERSNIILDGAGFSLEGPGSTGVYIANTENVTIRNINIVGFSYGVFLSNSTSCHVVSNHIENTTDSGVYVYMDSRLNNISSNDIISDGNGIWVRDSSNCTMFSNNITCERADNKFGIYLYYSSNNTMSSNVITQTQACIYIYHSSHNRLYGNNLTNSGWSQDGGGVWVDGSSFNIIHGNFISESHWHGIELFSSSNNTVSGNDVVSNSNRGIMVQSASNYNIITGNHVDGNYKGVELTSSSHHNVVSDNVLTANDHEGIVLDYSWNNTIMGNTLTENNGGIWIGDSDYNNLTENNITGDGLAIHLAQASHNSLSRNTLTDNYFGLRLQSSTENTLRDTILLNNTCGFTILGYNLPHFINNVDDSNVVNSKPIYYWVDVHSSTVPEDAACVILVECTNITVHNMNLSICNWQGVAVAHSRNITVTDNSIANNDEYAIWLRNSTDCYIAGNHLTGFIGLQLEYSSNNTITGNTLTAGGNWGSVNLAQSHKNTFYHNNFTDNYIHYKIDEFSVNDWDHGYPDGGNYWDNYEQRYPYANDVNSGPYQNETGSDDIWDLPYTLNENNIDQYPIVPEFPSPIVLSLVMLATLVTLAYRKRETLHPRDRQ